jgi:hypothetical protein
MKNLLRKWLGINEDMQAVAQDINQLVDLNQAQMRDTFEIFHALPFSAAMVRLTAKDAAMLTEPNGIQANSLPALLAGIVIKARQGESQLEIPGELSQEVRDELVKRGFKVEEYTGTKGAANFIIWT